MRVTQVHQFPVQDGGDVTVLLQKVSGPVVAMDDGHMRRHRAMVFQPADSPLGCRIRAHGPACNLLLPEFDVDARRIFHCDVMPHFGNRPALPGHTVQSRQCVNELLAQHAAVAFFQRRRAGRNPGHNGRAIDALAEQKGRAKDACIVARPVGPWHGNGAVFQ